MMGTKMNDINNIDSKSFHKFYGNLWLSEYQVEILKKNNIDINNFKNMRSLILYIENILNYKENEELEQVSIELSEYDYYKNVKK